MEKITSHAHLITPSAVLTVINDLIDLSNRLSSIATTQQRAIDDLKTHERMVDDQIGAMIGREKIAFERIQSLENTVLTQAHMIERHKEKLETLETIVRDLESRA